MVLQTEGKSHCQHCKGLYLRDGSEGQSCHLLLGTLLCELLNGIFE